MSHFHTTHNLTSFFPKIRLSSRLNIFVKCVFKGLYMLSFFSSPRAVFPTPSISLCFTLLATYTETYVIYKSRNFSMYSWALSLGSGLLVPSHPVTRHNIPEERKPRLHPCENLKFPWNVELCNILKRLLDTVQVQMFGCTHNFHARVIYFFRHV
jgi:hypothetical protein